MAKPFELDPQMINTEVQELRALQELMPNRIHRILLVSSLYDAFILEQDGPLNNVIFSAVADLNLNFFFPLITRADNGEEALKILKNRFFDLVITMVHLSDMDISAFGLAAKEINPSLSVILLVTSTYEYSLVRNKKIPGIDQTFVWQGDSKLFFAITKNVEDRQNVEHDTAHASVRVIILIEDSARYYSLFLPVLYSEIIKQAKRLASEVGSNNEKMFRVLARPKVLIAENYEEGMALYDKYKPYVLGIISDVSYYRGGVYDQNAGFEFVRNIKEDTKDMPCLLQSADPKNRDEAKRIGARFLEKSSKTLIQGLIRFLLSDLGFGDFVFRLKSGQEVTRARNLLELQELVLAVPEESLELHASSNHFSNWLMARGELAIAMRLRPIAISDFDSITEARTYIYQAIESCLMQKQTINNFSSYTFEHGNQFVRIGNGSMGGKARGVAFIRSLLGQADLFQKFKVNVSVPKTLILATDIFERFIEENQLISLATEEVSDQEVNERFLKSQLPAFVVSDLTRFISKVTFPLAVRSSSLLEDSLYKPFAGVYDTFILPNRDLDPLERLNQLLTAVKLVYASTYHKRAKAYIDTTDFETEEEKMGVMIQQVVGNPYQNYFYPDFSGVAQSHNFYPVSYMKPNEGIAHIALGLGRTIVEGGISLRFSPTYPDILPQLSSRKDMLQNTQRKFFALNLDASSISDTASTLSLLDLATAECHGVLEPLASVYNYEEDLLVDTLSVSGPRILTFASILKYNTFPLCELLKNILELGERGMGNPVEIEFAVNLHWNEENVVPQFYLLQIRPFATNFEDRDIEIGELDPEKTICKSCRALGNGLIDHVEDILYIPQEVVDSMSSPYIVQEISEFNKLLAEANRQYVLIGPGRWGSSDPSLGIPVTWDQISQAKVVVETRTQNTASIDPSDGTHFFHNITSNRVGYLTVSTHHPEDLLQVDWLKSRASIAEKKYVRHLRIPMEIRMEGKKRQAVILKKKS